jgi:rubrerythrin
MRVKEWHAGSGSNKGRSSGLDGEEIDMDRRSLLEAFRIAIEKEDESAKFYTDFAARADDPEMKTLLNRFAYEERIHGDKLKDLYRTLREAVE